MLALGKGGTKDGGIGGSGGLSPANFNGPDFRTFNKRGTTMGAGGGI